MANLYFKKTGETSLWNDVNNWFEDAACTNQASNAPWVAGDSAYLGYDLVRSADSIAADDNIVINADIGDGLTITGACSIGSVDSGTLRNEAGIYSGTFSGNGIINVPGSGFIFNGVFSGLGFNNENVIYGGIFSGSTFTNALGGIIYGGKFSGNGFLDYTAENNNGVATIYGGLFDTTTGLTGNTVGFGGTRYSFMDLGDALFLGGASWNDANNWFLDYECSIPYNSGVPWTTSETSGKNILKGYSMESFNNPGNLTIDTDLGDGFSITGACYINSVIDPNYSSYLINASTIHNGIFLGKLFTNDNIINGGVFSGDSFNNDNIIIGGDIYGGTFSGGGFTNNSLIYDGTFSGDDFTNNSLIYGGTFSGEGFVNNNEIYGGAFSGNNFGNVGQINAGIFSGSNFINDNQIFGGILSGSDFINNFAIKGGVFSGSGFTNNNYIYGGFWLEKGSIDAISFGSTASPYAIRIQGAETNPEPYDPTSGFGFTTLKIEGQDVLGGGLI